MNPDFTAFAGALELAGAKILAPLVHQPVRFKAHGRISIVSCSKKGKLGFCGEAEAAWTAFNEGRPIEFGPKKKKKIRRKDNPPPPPPDPKARPAITIFTDASFCMRTGAAGWGAWLKANDSEAVLVGDAFRDLVGNVNEAEFFGLVNAVFVARKLGLITAGQSIMLQCDNIRALNIVFTHVKGTVERKHENGAPVARVQLKRLTAGERKALLLLQKIQVETGITFIVRHVRGHRSGSGRNWVNRKCDELAKQFKNSRRALVEEPAR